MRNCWGAVREIFVAGVVATRAFVVVAGALVVLAVGAGRAVGQEAGQPPVPSAPPVVANPAQTTPEPNGGARGSVKQAIHWKRFDYTCEGGTKLTVNLHEEMAKVSYKDKFYFMKQVPSADGGRYSDGKVQWWGKGNGGFLQEDTPDGNGAMLVKDCKLDKPLNGGAAEGAGTGGDNGAASSSVSGTVSYQVRMALPPDAVIEVQLQDISRADAPARTIAQQKIELGDRQVPVPFEIKFDPAKIDAKHTYALQAQIKVEGQLRFTNEREYKVLTQGAPRHVDIEVRPAGAPMANRP